MTNISLQAVWSRGTKQDWANGMYNGHHQKMHKAEYMKSRDWNAMQKIGTTRFLKTRAVPAPLLFLYPVSHFWLYFPA